ncbi:MAG: TSUP family transporter, partial [Actinophytocola sp.]|nr:TSUP family transporter [Actinophytocola sp.]
GVSALGAMFGVGGPVIAVPILVVLGVPTLMAVGLSQVQSVVISGVATFGYAGIGAVLIPLVFLVGVPQMIGVWVGWRFAHHVNDRMLRICLGIVLVLITPALMV